MEARVFQDQMGRTVQLHIPQRIVSLVPSQTELLVDLGLKDKLVGITKFCVHPKGLLDEKKHIGGTKQLDFEAIRALNPDIIIANKEENEQGQIERLAEEFPVWISDIQTLEEAWDMMLRLGDIFQVKNEASQLVEQSQSKWDGLKTLNGHKNCLYFIWRRPYMLAGKETFIHYILEKLGLKNLGLNLDGRYPEISTEQIREMQADYVFLSSEPYPFKEKNKREMETMSPGTRVHLVDGEFFSWYGSRLLKAPQYFEQLLSELKQ